MMIKHHLRGFWSGCQLSTDLEGNTPLYSCHFLSAALERNLWNKDIAPQLNLGKESTPRMGKFKISSAGLNNSNNQNESMLLPVPRQSFWQTSTNQTPQCCQEQAFNATWVLPHFPHPLNKWKNSSYHVTISYCLSESLWQGRQRLHMADVVPHTPEQSRQVTWTVHPAQCPGSNSSQQEMFRKRTQVWSMHRVIYFPPRASYSHFPLQTPISQVFHWARKPPSHLISFSGF